MRALRRSDLVICIWLSLTYAASAADNWTQFRGPGGQGKAPDADLPVKWTEKNVKWRTPVHGRAWSSPVVWGKQIWMTTATPDGHKLSVVCVDFDSGKIVHDRVVFNIKEPQDKQLPKNSFASPTPVIEEGRLYVSFGVHGTACLDTKTGKTLWARQDLKCNHWRGPGSSPILDGNRLILHFDGYDFQYVIALDKGNGKTIWKRDRNDDFDYKTDNGDLKKAFGTPAVLEMGGKRHLVSPAAVATVAYDPETGKTLWTCRTEGMNAAGIPMQRNGLVYVTNGMGKLFAVRPNKNKGNHEAEIIWTEKRSMCKAPSPLLIGNRIFTINDKQGIASWLDAESGKIIWQKRIGDSYSASPLYAKGHIYVLGEFGKITVLAAKDDYQILASMENKEGFMASPAVIGDTLILRSKTALYRIER